MLAPQVKRVIGFGNCDAATALASFGRATGIDSLVLANPWVGDEGDALPPAAAIRSHYAGRVKDPRQWLRALSGGIDIGKAIKGLRKASAKSPGLSNAIADRMAVALVDTPHMILLAERDNTAVRFADAWTHGGTIERLDSDSHSFAPVGDREWLGNKIRAAIDAL